MSSTFKLNGSLLTLALRFASCHSFRRGSVCGKPVGSDFVFACELHSEPEELSSLGD